MARQRLRVNYEGSVHGTSTRTLSNSPNANVRSPKSRRRKTAIAASSFKLTGAKAAKRATKINSASLLGLSTHIKQPNLLYEYARYSEDEWKPRLQWPPKKIAYKAESVPVAPGVIGTFAAPVAHIAIVSFRLLAKCVCAVFRESSVVAVNSSSRFLDREAKPKMLPSGYAPVDTSGGDVPAVVALVACHQGQSKMGVDHSWMTLLSVESDSSYFANAAASAILVSMR
eukprot:scaffold449089_cov47-Prasinocladus_malaysianus.AAC.1